MIIFCLLNFIFSRLSAIRGKSSCLLLGVAGPSPSLTIMIFFNIAITIIAFFVTKSISSPPSWLPTSITLSLNHHHHDHHPHYPHRHHGITIRPGDCCPSSWDCSLWEARKSNNSMCFFSRSITKRSHRWWCILRFLIQQNTALFSTFRPSVRPSVRHRRDISTFLDILTVFTMKTIYFLNAYHLGW